MSRQSERVRAILRLRRMRNTMIFGYGLIVVIAVVGITIFVSWQNDRILRSKISDMTTTLNVQMQKNLDSYLNRMEKVGTLAFASDDAYTYDATDETNDEYEAINTEKAIADELMSLCMLENFVDYGIVYRNNHTVGKVSNGTTELFGNALYSGLEAMITNEKTHDGWHTGYGEDYERIYYVKRVHDNAVLVLSFYTAELRHVFENPESMENMTVRLTDENYKVVYSSDKSETLGDALPAEISRYTMSSITGSLMDFNNLVSINGCDVGWYVICSMPTNVVMRERNEMQVYVYIAAAIATLLAVLAGALFSSRIADPTAMIAINMRASDLDSEENEDDYDV